MKNIKPYLLLVFFVIALITACSVEKEEIERIKTLSGNEITVADMDSYLKAQMDSMNIKGISIAIINDAKVVYHRSFGIANIYSLDTVNDQTIFEAASISKPIFAYFVMRMVEKGVLDLDTPLYQYLPYPAIEHDDCYMLITARMVLNHTTGFPNWRSNNFFNQEDGKLFMDFTPGTKFSYSGEGYVYLAKVIACQENVPTPPFLRIDTISEIDTKISDIEKLGNPLFIKPVTGGSSQGIRNSAKVESLESLRNEVTWILDNCHDSVLVESFIRGREFCVGLLETDSLEILPVAELEIQEGDPEAFYSFELKSSHRKKVICPADISPEITRKMEEDSLRLFKAMGCRDLSRVDFRLGEGGVPLFLEINPLPGLSPFYSIFTIQAEAGGIKPQKVIEILINNALSRG